MEHILLKQRSFLKKCTNHSNGKEMALKFDEKDIKTMNGLDEYLVSRNRRVCLEYVSNLTQRKLD